jgi:hypothetical protein
MRHKPCAFLQYAVSRVPPPSIAGECIENNDDENVVTKVEKRKKVDLYLCETEACVRPLALPTSACEGLENTQWGSAEGF